MRISIDGNVSQMPNPNDDKDNFHFKTGDGRVGCRFSVACGYGQNKFFVNVRVFDREALGADEFPDRFKHAASWIMFHTAKGSQISFDARIEGDWREKQQRSSGAGWRRGNSGGNNNGGREYRGMLFIPTSVFEVGAHTGERGLLTAIRRNLDNPKVAALFDLLAEDGDETERNGPRYTYNPNNDDDGDHFPPTWHQLNEVEALRQELTSDDSSDNTDGDTTPQGDSPDADGKPEEDEDEVPF